ncbi:tetratricopeptide repeat protein [Paraliomyxa miuraensis]|uniref:tetratricopeptide repeat protein n=1 Tax=Paraliomyxa miuraensis TaxID=376150 RepID=UPI002257D4DE|nr:tetratricopeptide repeat protein [Paraliomyxa miuraensis]MCX4244573.1 tetratricopeptide repeat protein [Paraliomyxa miuraensis]
MSDEEAKEADRTGSSTGGDAKPASPESKADAKPEADAGGERRDLPKWNRARVKRKAPAGEEQDAFQVSVRRAGRGILQRPLAVIGLIMAISGAGAGIYAWTAAAEGNRAESTRTLSVAVAYEARGQVYEGLAELTADRVRPLPVPVVEDAAALQTKVDAALTDLEEQAPDSPANEAADLVRAARLARASDYEGAEKAYRGFLQRQPGHALVFMARDGLIVSLEGQGRYDDALAEVEPLLGEAGDFFRDQALWHQGRLYEAKGDTAKAIEIYTQYKTEYPFEQASLARESVKARLEALDPSAVPASGPGAGAGGLGVGGLGGFGP